MTVSLEMQVRIAELRQKARDGILTLEETKEGIRFLREERLAMPPSKSSTKKNVPPPSEDDLAAELGF